MESRTHDTGRQNSDSGEDDRVAYGVSAMQGWRISMEDAHAAVLDLKPEFDGEAPKDASEQTDRLSFFGVYDGHGGDKVAIFAGQNVHKIIAKQEAFKRRDYDQALKDGFLATDRAILNGPLPRRTRRGNGTLIWFEQIPSTKRRFRAVRPLWP